MFQHVHRVSTIGLAIVLCGSIVSAAASKNRPDAIELIGSIQLHGANVSHIQRAEDHGRTLLYLEDSQRHGLTVIDVTDSSRPRIVREIAINDAFDNLEILPGGTAVLATGASPSPEKVMSLSIVSIEDNGDNHKTTRSFPKVSAFLTDDQRGLVYVADQEGLKVLRTKSRTDSDVDREFEKRILYDR